MRRTILLPSAWREPVRIEVSSADGSVLVAIHVAGRTLELRLTILEARKVAHAILDAVNPTRSSAIDD